MRLFQIASVPLVALNANPDIDSQTILEDPFLPDFGADLADLNEDWDAEWGWADENYDSSLSGIPDLYGSSKSDDLDIDPDGPCKADLLSHPECNYGSDKAVCLWMNAADAGRWASRFGSSEWFRPISLDCKNQLIEFLTNASSSPLEYFKDLRVECDQDLQSLCTNVTKEQTALACLRANFDTIESSDCRDEIAHLNSWTSLNVSWWSPTLWRDCSEERKGICVNSTSSGLSDLRDCLDDHREGLSDKCHHSLFESDLQAAPNPYVLRRDLAAQCKSESKEYCSDVVNGDENQLFCLYRASKRHSDRFNPVCATQVESVVKLLESDYRMNVPIRKFCRRTINEYCSSEKDENDKSLHESDEVMSCLKRVYLYGETKKRQQSVSGSSWRDYEETEACMHAVRQSVLIDSLDWEVDSSLHSNCFQDYHALLLRKVCEGEAVQPPQQCLQEHFSELSNEECRKAVALHSQLSALDQDFKPQLLASCALALDELDCSEFAESAEHHVGKDGLVECLYSKVQQIQDGYCRAAIRRDFSLSERDFRLSYELSLVCSKDRVRLCGSESPEKVLSCMISHLDEIGDHHCHRDVARLAFVAMNEGQDAVEKTACAGDVKNFCSDTITAHGNVHACLLQHLGELSKSCSEAVLNLHISTASQQAMEKLLNSACSEVLVEDECRHLITGKRTGDEGPQLQAKADCIRAVIANPANEDVRLSKQCNQQLIAVESLLSADYRTNPELQRDCKTDTSVLCSAELERSASTSGFSTEVIQCLVQQRTRVRNSNCKKQILRQIYKMSEDVDMAIVCKNDLLRFCAGIPAGEGRLHSCLREHLTELSHECLAQEFAVTQMETLAAATVHACSFELTSGFCKRTHDLHCLWRNIDESKPECSNAVRKEMKGKIGNIWLDPSLYSKCRVSVNELVRQGTNDRCPSYLVELQPPKNGLIPLPVNYTQAIAGEHVACLGSNRGKIGDRSCLNAIETLLRMEISDPLLLRFGLRTSCRSEMEAKGVCGASDPFDTLDQWKCLQRNVLSENDQLSKGCMDSVKRMWRLSLYDVKFNPDVSTNCEWEIGSICKGLSSSKVVVCLNDRFKSNEGEFTSECSEAMKRMPPPSAVDFGNGWKKLEDQLPTTTEDLPIVEQLRLLKEVNSSGTMIELNGPLALVSLASLVVVVIAGLYRLYRYKINKGYMVIVEKD
jgi:hypothetical protein